MKVVDGWAEGVESDGAAEEPDVEAGRGAAGESSRRNCRSSPNSTLRGEMSCQRSSASNCNLARTLRQDPLLSRLAPRQPGCMATRSSRRSFSSTCSWPPRHSRPVPRKPGEQERAHRRARERTSCSRYETLALVKHRLTRSCLPRMAGLERIEVTNTSMEGAMAALSCER